MTFVLTFKRHVFQYRVDTNIQFVFLLPNIQFVFLLPGHITPYDFAINVHEQRVVKYED